MAVQDDQKQIKGAEKKGSQRNWWETNSFLTKVQIRLMRKWSLFDRQSYAKMGKMECVVSKEKAKKRKKKKRLKKRWQYHQHHLHRNF